MEGQVLLYVTAGVAILSELVAVIPSLKSNSVVQLIINIGKKLTSGK